MKIFVVGQTELFVVTWVHLIVLMSVDTIPNVFNYVLNQTQNRDMTF